jgi:cytochrome P450
MFRLLSPGAVTIRAGAPALVVLAANRDPAAFTRPDHFQPNRPGPAPLTFGYGAHYCLGTAIARLEIATALRHVLARRPAVWAPDLAGHPCHSRAAGSAYRLWLATST